MSYTPTDWKKGDVVTSEKLNNMESGIEDAQIIVNVNVDEDAATHVFSNITPDKNHEEILAIIESGKNIGFYLHGNVIYETQTVSQYIYYTSSCHVENGFAIFVSFSFVDNSTAGMTNYSLLLTSESTTIDKKQYILTTPQ